VPLRRTRFRRGETLRRLTAAAGVAFLRATAFGSAQPHPAGGVDREPKSSTKKSGSTSACGERPSPPRRGTPFRRDCPPAALGRGDRGPAPSRFILRELRTRML